MSLVHTLLINGVKITKKLYRPDNLDIDSNNILIYIQIKIKKICI